MVRHLSQSLLLLLQYEAEILSSEAKSPRGLHSLVEKYAPGAGCVLPDILQPKAPAAAFPARKCRPRRAVSVNAARDLASQHWPKVSSANMPLDFTGGAIATKRDEDVQADLSSHRKAINAFTRWQLESVE